VSDTTDADGHEVSVLVVLHSCKTDILEHCSNWSLNFVDIDSRFDDLMIDGTK